MNCVKLLSLVLAVGVVGVLAGCSNARKTSTVAATQSTGSSVAGREVAQAGTGTPPPPAPARQLKPAAQLTMPPGIAAEDISEVKLPKSSWPQYVSAYPGDVMTSETANEGTVISRSRIEVFDVADHAIMNVLETTIILAGNETRSKSGLKYVFTEPDAPAEGTDPKAKHDKKADTRKFKVGAQEYTADTRIDVYAEGKLSSRHWTSKELPPSAILLMESADGKVTTRLVEFVRKGK